MSEPTMTINENGTKYWRNEAGELHREDGPAIEWPHGTKFWYQKGKLHRVDGPAIESADGTKEWYQKGKLHRVDGHAVEEANGMKEWYQNGVLHRVDGPAVEDSDGTKTWYIRDKHLGDGLKGFWALWNHLSEEERQNVNLHIWLVRLQNV